MIHEIDVRIKDLKSISVGEPIKVMLTVKVANEKELVKNKAIKKELEKFGEIELSVKAYLVHRLSMIFRFSSFKDFLMGQKNKIEKEVKEHEIALSIFVQPGDSIEVPMQLVLKNFVPCLHIRYAKTRKENKQLKRIDLCNYLIFDVSLPRSNNLRIKKEVMFEPMISDLEFIRSSAYDLLKKLDLDKENIKVNEVGDILKGIIRLDDVEFNFSIPTFNRFSRIPVVNGLLEKLTKVLLFSLPITFSVTNYPNVIPRHYRLKLSVYHYFEYYENDASTKIVEYFPISEIPISLIVAKNYQEGITFLRHRRSKVSIILTEDRMSVKFDWKISVKRELIGAFLKRIEDRYIVFAPPPSFLADVNGMHIASYYLLKITMWDGSRMKWINMPFFLYGEHSISNE